MDLQAAIKLAVRFAEKGEKGKEPPINHYVRFLPGHETQRAKICAQNARCGVLLSLDEGVSVPNTLLKSSLLAAVAKDAKYEITMATVAYGGVEIKSGPATWQVQANEVPQLGWFPEIPAVPSGFHAIDGCAIERVIHAASKADDRPALRSVNFREGFVEATDKARFARARLGGGWCGLLPVEMFQRLGNDWEALFTTRQAFLRVADDCRFANYVPLSFPDCAQLIPENHTGAEGIVSVEPLARAAKQALAVSDTGSVTLQIGTDRVKVTAWQREGEEHLFEATVTARTNGSGQLLLSGKHLVDALKEFSTPAARIRYNRPVDPLRLESAGYVEAIWPMLV